MNGTAPKLGIPRYCSASSLLWILVSISILIITNAIDNTAPASAPIAKFLGNDGDTGEVAILELSIIVMFVTFKFSLTSSLNVFVT